MQLITVSCNHCGAPLRVPEGAQYVTCNHCSSQLSIRHTDSVTFTEKLEKIDQRTERIEDELADLRYQRQLEQIDRNWKRERETFMITGKDGHRQIPTAAGSIFGAIVLVAFGIFWTVMASRIGGGGFALFGVIFIVFGIGVSIYSYSKSQAYVAAERRYRRRRREARKD